MAEPRAVTEVDGGAAPCAAPEAGGAREAGRPLIAHASDGWGIAGFGLCLAWVYLMMTCSVADGTRIPQFTATLLVVVFLVGEAAAAALVASSASRLASHRAIRTLSWVAALLLTLPGLAALVPLSETLLFAAWFLSGFGSMLLLSLWGFFLARLAHSYAPFYTALSALLGAALLVLVRVCLKEDVFPFANIVIGILSVVLFAVWSRHLRAEGNFAFPEKTRPPDLFALLHSAVAMVANNFLLGFGFYAVAVSTGLVGGGGLIVCGLVVAALYKVIDTRTRLIYQVDVIVKVIAPVAAICILLLPFVSVPVRYGLLFCLIVIAMIDEIVCWSAVAEYMYIHQVQPFANMTFGRFGEIVGLLLGFCSGGVIFGASLDGPVEPSLFASCVVIAFICIQAFFFRDNYTPFVEHREMDEELSVPSVDDAAPREERGSWEASCRGFAEHYGLTPRQTEVLLLLTKGYSMGAIEQQLVVSIHTVKAHVYGIYQKADVHSRQELIEKIKAEEDAPAPLAS